MSSGASHMGRRTARMGLHGIPPKLLGDDQGILHVGLCQVALPEWARFPMPESGFDHLAPKRCDASFLGDYRPISLIHIFTKLAAKVLATRLAPRLSALVERNQCAFIQKRCIHDNFMMVQQTARLLHRLKEPRVMLKA
jgi:hypothetical protein